MRIMMGGMPSGPMMKPKPYDYMMNRDANSIGFFFYFYNLIKNFLMFLLENYFPQMYPQSQMMNNYMGPPPQQVFFSLFF